MVMLEIERPFGKHRLDRIHVALRAAGKHFTFPEIGHRFAQQLQIQTSHRPGPVRLRPATFAHIQHAQTGHQRLHTGQFVMKHNVGRRTRAVHENDVQTSRQVETGAGHRHQRCDPGACRQVQELLRRMPYGREAARRA